MTGLDNDWAIEVAQMCDPVFDAADVGFKRQVTYADEDRRVVASGATSTARAVAAD